jgi:hypothetical protein
MSRCGVELSLGIFGPCGAVGSQRGCLRQLGYNSICKEKNFGGTGVSRTHRVPRNIRFTGGSRSLRDYHPKFE